jgi:hypothetical protein
MTALAFILKTNDHVNDHVNEIRYRVGMGPWAKRAPNTDRSGAEQENGRRATD